MSPDAHPLPPDDEARLAALVEVVVAIASNDFGRRAHVGDGSHLLDGLATGVNMLAEEVAEQHARERESQQRMRQSERLAAIGQLAAGVAHEINNPAAFVLANLSALDLLLKDPPRAGAPGSEEFIRQAADITIDCLRGIDRIVAIVRDLRRFARHENDRQETLQLDALVAEACKMVRAEMAYRARLVVQGAAPPPVRGDRTKIVQVLTNLLLNAAQAIPEGAADRHEITVAVFARGETAVVRVTDTGSGIPPEVQGRIFEPLFTTKSRESGLGLGLSISADILKRHGGEIRLVRTSPGGSVFEVILPVAAAVSLPTSAPVAPPVPATRKSRVLFIDDEDALLVAMRRLYASRYDVGTASGGRSAIALLARDAAWEAIICDLMMPDLDGPAVFEWVRAHRPELADRMLFCSGGAFTPRGDGFAELMGDRLLQKPVRPDVLRAAIERLPPLP